jgi:hypothetical protein
LERELTAMSQALIPAQRALDHLLLGVADLERGCARVAELTGVEPAIGGRHPGMGTRNALISLGSRQYLEIIAPDPAQTTSTFWTDLRLLPEPRLVGWAAITPDLDGLVTRARDAGLSIVGPRDGSRTRPDGSVLAWRTASAPDTFGRGGVEVIPFFIQWTEGSRHPSEDSPHGCELRSFQLQHTDPAAVVETLKRLGIDTTVSQASEGVVRATLATPRGLVHLG